MKFNNLCIILWLALLIRLAGAGQVAYYLAPQGIATDGAKEWSQGIRQAMLSGAASLATDEWNRPALALNGTEGAFAIDLPEGLAPEFTLACWFRAKELPGEVAPRLLASWGDSFQLMLLGRRVYFQMTEANGLPLWEHLQPLVRQNEWVHLALTWSEARGEAEFFWNGTPVAKRWTHAPLKLAESETRLVFGGPDGSFAGDLAEIRLFDEALRAPVVARLAATERREIPASKEISAWPVPAWGASPILPDTPAGLSGEVLLRVCPGERESASFALRSEMAHAQIVVELASMPRNAAGRELPAELFHFQVVKCWYQAGFAGVDPEPQDKSLRVLVPELLLNDDSLVRVDDALQTNFLRLGDHYEDISQPAERTDHIWINRLTAEAFPVRDAESLQPFDLPARTTRQLWLKAGPFPADTPAGTYTGTIRIASADGTSAELPLQVEVLPFNLLEPSAFYDSTRPFVCSLYDHTWVHTDAGGIDPFLRDLRQYRVQLADMLAHGITSPLCCALSAVSRPDLFTAMLRARAETGMKDRPLYLFNCGEIENTLKEEPTPERRAQVRAWTRQILDTVEETLGHREVFLYGVDEAEGEALRRQLTYWDDMHAEGAKVYTSGHHAAEQVEGRQDVMNQYKVVGASYAEDWHKYGKAIWSYGHPQAGAENPELYRRNYGLPLWRMGYDGICTYVYYDDWGNPWNDFDSAIHRDIGFVYPTMDGVVDTLAWEGYAAAVADIRYACTLRAAAEAKPESPVAVQARKWLETADFTEEDLDGMRNMAIDLLLELQP